MFKYFKKNKENDASESSDIMEGIFRKCGANVKSWKVRQYRIKSDKVLYYYSPSNDELKGSISVASVRYNDNVCINDN
jgi:hypothetical protein